MKEYIQQVFDMERALYAEHGSVVRSCVFKGGESAVKECSDLEVSDSVFEWKYPVWYSKNLMFENCTVLKDGRAGFWYIDGLTIVNSTLDSPKNIRRCSDIVLENVSFTDGNETLWACRNAKLKNIHAKGDYFAMNSENIVIDGLDLVGGYSFDGVKNVVIRNSRIVGRDVFWNSENVTVYDSFLTGAYLTWNAKNVRFVNCTIESLQGLCYSDELRLEGCRLINTSLAFEYSDVHAELVGSVDSIFNPKSGYIKADSVKELTMDSSRIDPERTVTDIKEIGK